VSTPVPGGEQSELAALRALAQRLGVGDDVQLLSPWTPLPAPGPALLSGAADLLLRFSPVPVLGVTGSAGKTTTARLAEAMLRASGIETLTSSDAPADNAWPTAALLERVLAARPGAWCVAELTSNHLAVCSASPKIACITNVWADHIDQHGSLEAYLAAKRRIVAFQGPDDWTVVNADDPGAGELAAGSAARILCCTLGEPVGDACAGVEAGRLTMRLGGRAFDLGPAGALPPAPGREAGLLAGACALLAGASPGAIAGALAGWTGLALRRERLGVVGGATVIRDALAATPAKAAAGLALHAPGSVVLIAGGYDDLGGGPLHASPEERAQFEQAAAVAARACAHAALFGPAGPRLATALKAAGLASVEVHATLAGACAGARAYTAPGRALVFAPWFPTTPAERAAIPELLGLLRR
jgi:UDP-N-acetylmuramoylalanine--D-glutamate ligase